MTCHTLLVLKMCLITTLWLGTFIHATSHQVVNIPWNGEHLIWKSLKKDLIYDIKVIIGGRWSSCLVYICYYVLWSNTWSSLFFKSVMAKFLVWLGLIMESYRIAYNNMITIVLLKLLFLLSFALTNYCLSTQLCCTSPSF